jgi:hypothetical protein
MDGGDGLYTEPPPREERMRPYHHNWNRCVVGGRSRNPASRFLEVHHAVRVAADVYRDSHWRGTGYGNHLLFMRLYEEAAKVVDSTAELLVGHEGTGLDLLTQPAETLALVAGIVDLFDRSLAAVDLVLSRISTAFNEGPMSPGWDDELMRLGNLFETHRYLLRQGRPS